MAARTRKGSLTSGGWPAVVRDRIKSSMLINRLQDHAVGKVDLQPTQIKAIEILLRKTLPDLSQVSGVIANVNVNASDLSDAELAAIATGRSAGTALAEDGAQEPDSIH